MNTVTERRTTPRRTQEAQGLRRSRSGRRMAEIEQFLQSVAASRPAPQCPLYPFAETRPQNQKNRWRRNILMKSGYALMAGIVWAGLLKIAHSKPASEPAQIAASLDRAVYRWFGFHRVGSPPVG